MKYDTILPLARILLMLALSTSGIAHAATVLRLASDDWCPFVCATDGKLSGGFLVDASRRALSLAGYRVDAVLMPLNRAIRQSIDGDIDGVYAPPIDERFLLSAPLAFSRACFHTRIDDDWTYQGLASLAGLTLGVIDDYGYDAGPMDAYIARHRQKPVLVALAFGGAAGTTNVQKMLGGRYRVMLEHAAVMTHLSKSLGVTRRVRQAGCLDDALPLALGFANRDKRGEAPLRALADGLRQMDASGELRTLRQRYQIP